MSVYMWFSINDSIYTILILLLIEQSDSMCLCTNENFNL